MEERRPRAPAGCARGPRAAGAAGHGVAQLTRTAALLDDRALLARLIGFDSTSRKSNLPLADFLADYLDRPGIRVERNASPDGSKTNLVVTAGPEAEDRDGLVMSGHMDVVPADESGWRSDPFELNEAGDRYVGRGTADMKGFLALATNRLAAQRPQDLRRPVALVFTYDEEVGTVGARRFTETFRPLERLPLHVVIGEPTRLRAVSAHKGMLRLRLEFSGRAAHSGYPHLGRSAIEPAARAIVALAELRAQLELERPPHGEAFPEVPFVALNVGTVAGGSAANVIPDRCEIHLGVRVLPGITMEDIAARVRGAVVRAVPEPFTLEPVSESPPMLLDQDAPILRAVCEAVGQRETHSVMFASDAGWLQRAGFQTVLFGPGDIQVAHQPNEFIPIAEFRRAGELLDGLIRRSCLRA